LEHAVHWLEFHENDRPDIIVQVRPTSPFRHPGLIDEAIEILLARPDADSVRTVAPSGENPFKMWRIENETLKPLLQSGLQEPYNMPRQALPDTFWQTGHVEVIRYRTIFEKRSLTGDIILPCIVPHEYAIDLDNFRQWDFAEYVLDCWNFEIVVPRKMIAPAVTFDFFKMPS
jgi:N-acylneuraminate cytidylyltransferase